MNPVPLAPVPTPPKKGMSGLAMVGFGCLGLVVIMGIVGILAIKACTHEVGKIAEDFQKNPGKAAAMIIIRANPDLEIVKTDDTAGEITVRDKKSGEVTTLSFNDVSQGKFQMKNAKGDVVTFDSKGKDGNGSVVVKNSEGTTVIGGQDSAAPPAWVPRYPSAQDKSGGMRVEKTDSINGIFSAETTDAASKVKDFFESNLKGAGFTEETTNIASGDTEMMIVKSSKNDGKTKVDVTISAEKGNKTQMVIHYEGPKS